MRQKYSSTSIILIIIKYGILKLWSDSQSLRFPSQLRALAAFKQQQKESLQILDGEKARTIIIIIIISLYNTAARHTRLSISKL